jgi:hypothetical protein
MTTFPECVDEPQFLVWLDTGKHVNILDGLAKPRVIHRCHFLAATIRAPSMPTSARRTYRR